MSYNQSSFSSNQRSDTTASRNLEDNVDNPPPQNEIGNLDTSLNMTAPMINSYTPHFHSNGSELPFDNLDVQELWDWMGNLSDYDNYSYQGSY